MREAAALSSSSRRPHPRPDGALRQASWSSRWSATAWRTRTSSASTARGPAGRGGAGGPRGQAAREAGLLPGGQEFPDEEVLSSLVGRFYDELEEPVPTSCSSPAPGGRRVKEHWLGELGGRPVEIRVPAGTPAEAGGAGPPQRRSNFETRRHRNSDLLQALAKLQQRLRLGRLPRASSATTSPPWPSRRCGLHGGAPERRAQPPGYRRFKVRAAARTTSPPLRGALPRLRRAGREAGLGAPGPPGGGRRQGPALHGLLACGLACPKGAGPGCGGPGQGAPGRARRPIPAARPGSCPAGPGLPPHIKDPCACGPTPTSSSCWPACATRPIVLPWATSAPCAVANAALGLQDIPGIGPIRRQQLLRHLGSLKRVQGASLEELRAVPHEPQSRRGCGRYFAAGGPASPAGRPEEE